MSLVPGAQHCASVVLDQRGSRIFGGNPEFVQPSGENVRQAFQPDTCGEVRLESLTYAIWLKCYEIWLFRFWVRASLFSH